MKQLIDEQMARSLTNIEAYTGALLVHTSALLAIVIILASLGLGFVVWSWWKNR